jgi:hypothetical protein
MNSDPTDEHRHGFRKYETCAATSYMQMAEGLRSGREEAASAINVHVMIIAFMLQLA